MRRIEVGQGFIHQQHIGFNCQSAGQQHPLALAARELAQRPAPPFPRLRGPQRPLHRCPVGRAWRSQPGLMRQAAQHGDIVHGEIIPGGFILAQPRQLSGAPWPGQTAQQLASQGHRARVRQQMRQHFQQGGFARAIGADDTGPAGLGDLQRNGMQHRTGTQTGGDGVGLYCDAVQGPNPMRDGVQMHDDG